MTNCEIAFAAVEGIFGGIPIETVSVPGRSQAVFLRDTRYRLGLDITTEGLPVTLTLYGIKACDTMKKARTWLDEHQIAYVFHDYKAQGIDAASISRWIDVLGWETVLNRAGTTFRKLDDADKVGLDAARATALMVAQPSMIKRPILEHPGGIMAGFKPDLYAAALL